MKSWFSGCYSLSSFSQAGFDTSIVTDMSYMFANCTLIRSLDLSEFDTSAVTDMKDMFLQCTGLENLDVSGFDTSAVVDMGSMFYYCKELTNLDVSKFNTANVTNMSGMFGGCQSLTTIDVSKFDTSAVTSMSTMFSGCSSLTNLDLSHFDTSAVTYMGAMFSGCSNLSSLDISGFDTRALDDSSVIGGTAMGSMFEGLDQLSEIILGEKFTTWGDDSSFPVGTWVNEEKELIKTEQELCSDYGQNAAIWKGTWNKLTAVDSGMCGDNVSWHLMSNGTLYIFGTGAMWDFSTSNDTNPGMSPWHSYNSQINEIYIGKDVTYIGKYAFNYCSAVSVAFHSSLTIGEGAFQNSGIVSLDFGSYDMTLGHWAFFNSAISQVSFGTGDIYLGNNSFMSCKSLEHIEIPANVSLGYEVFQFAGLKSATVGINGPLPRYTFEVCTSLTAVELTGSITSIGDGCFRGAPLESLTLPASVTEISETVLNRLANDGYAPDVPLLRVENPILDISVLKYGISQSVTTLEGPACSKTAAFAQLNGYTFNAIDSSSHTEAIGEHGVAASCNEDGTTDQVICSVCGYVIQAQQTVPSLGHDMTLVSAVDATCEGNGIISHYVCGRCGSLFLDESGETELEEDDIYIPATGHVWSDSGTITKEATCTEEGTIIYVCINDNSHTKTEPVPALGHAPGETQQENVISPDCENQGSYEEAVYCTVCGQELSREEKISEALGHDLQKTEKLEATCEEDGHLAYYTCQRCEKYFSDTMGEDEINISDTVIPATGHAWGEWTVTKEATEEEEGLETRYCSNDTSHMETRIIPRLDHVHVPEKTSAKAATCEESGNIEYWTCTGCGLIFSDKNCENNINIEDTVVPATGHNWGEWTVTKEATEEEEGIETRHCSNDSSHTETRPIPKLEHVHNAERTPAKAAACEEAGNIEYWTCAKCGKIFGDAECENEIQEEDTIIVATGHDYELANWNWAENYSEATAEFVCKNDSSHVMHVTESSIVEILTDDEGVTKKIYTVAIRFDGYVYTDTRTEARNGWYKEGGYWYYYREGKIVKEAWVKDSTGWHWLGADGKMLTNGWAQDSAGWCWMDSNGNISKSRWIQYESDWYYLKDNGYRAENEWCKDSKGWHWIQSDGKMLTNGWARDSVGWCWMDSNGNMVYSKWVKDGDYWYYVKDSGYRAENEWCKDSKGWHWLGTDGKMLTNGWAKDSAGWMWMDGDGNITKSKWIKYEDGWYYVKASGYRAASEWCKDSTGWHWIEPNGRMLTNGWAKDSKGWCWMDGNGNMTYSKWVKDGDSWYYIKSSGYRAESEWCKDSQGWHWMQADGKMLTNGWAKDSKGWCWMDDNGNIVKSEWIETEDGTYYVNSSGYRVTGKQTIDGKTYSFDSNGRLI
ncbi:MAG: BspA family leucine-rich repeat surface protein [Oscillospiraceae bacterium]|nr:BspA family leucine-rich repeat surface protein [Oscillospiraceae bacterium]